MGGCWSLNCYRTYKHELQAGNTFSHYSLNSDDDDTIDLYPPPCKDWQTVSELSICTSCQEEDCSCNNSELAFGYEQLVTTTTADVPPPSISPPKEPAEPCHQNEGLVHMVTSYLQAITPTYFNNSS